MRTLNLRTLTPLLLTAMLVMGTMTGCKTAYYATMEKFGVAKRDLLKKRVTAARRMRLSRSAF